jgi:hypothetical protein
MDQKKNEKKLCFSSSLFSSFLILLVTYKDIREKLEREPDNLQGREDKEGCALLKSVALEALLVTSRARP